MVTNCYRIDQGSEKNNTSNCVERLFSIAKYVYTPQRQSMLPMNLEMLLFLRVNEPIWTKKFVCEALSEDKTKNVVD